METLDGVTGDWGPNVWGDSGGFDLPNGPQVQAKDVLTQTTVSDGQDKWSSFFQNLIGTTAQYALQKDAVKSGIKPTTNVAGGTSYVPANTPGSSSTMGWVIVGGAVLLAVALVASHNKG